jgi:hypothetical protein
VEQQDSQRNSVDAKEGMTGETFIHYLAHDVNHAHERLIEEDIPVNRRHMVRTAFSGIEGVVWEMKRDVLRHLKQVGGGLTLHEEAALLEQTYSVTSRGRVQTTPRFLPLPTAVRLLVLLVQKVRPEYKVDFSHYGWTSLVEGVAVRNRLVHPKRKEDLVVTDRELGYCMSGFIWLLALALEMRVGLNDHFKETVAEMQQLEDRINRHNATKREVDDGTTRSTEQPET